MAQFLAADLLDELQLHIVPVVLGAGGGDADHRRRTRSRVGHSRAGTGHHAKQRRRSDPGDLCRRAATVLGTVRVIAAYPTTVREVRERRGGPWPGHSPAEEPWARLAADSPAAWCTMRTGKGYVVAAAGPDGSLLTFMHSNGPLGTDEGGPKIP